MQNQDLPVQPSPPQLEIIAFAQNAEDVVLYRTFRGVREGFYVDVGSGHPTEGSVTKNLVDLLDWSGIDIEPQASLAHALRLARPRSTVIDSAIGLGSSDRTFYRLEDNWGMSTLDQEIAMRHREAGWTVREDVVSVVTMNDVLEGVATPGFELLKIDVEGAEEEVVGSMDLDYWRPQVIVIEATVPASTESVKHKWEHHLIDARYELCLFDGLNCFYVAEGASHLKQALSIPANVFDRFIHLRWWRELSLARRNELDPLGMLLSDI